MADDALAERLRGVCGTAHVLDDPQERAGYERDWTGRYGADSRLVVRPASTDEVAEVVRLCAEAGQPLVPQGGNTGLVGASVPRGGEVVLSLARLDELEPVDEAAAQVTAGAGVTLARLQDHAAAAGLAFGVDFAARDSATIGGMVATNAGGVHVLRYGPMRAQVVGVEAVLADGHVTRRLTGLIKDNAGYDLPGLLTGSEGTLAVVTRVRLRLHPTLPERAVAVLAVDDTAAACAVHARLRRRVPTLHAVELFFADGLDLVLRHTDASPPFPTNHRAYVLVECAGHDDPLPALAEAVDGAPEVRDAAVAADRPGRDRLWALRERHTEAIAAEGVPHKLDVTLPAAQLASFVDRVHRAVEAARPGARTVLFGHLGDGNLHVNVLGLPPDDDAVDDAVLRLVADHGGSTSAEHGVGVAKSRWLHLSRDEADIAAMRAIKRALDPAGILNPGVLLG